MFDDNKLEFAISEAGLAGAIALIGNRDGISYHRAFGVSDVSDGTAMQHDTLVQIASMTKAVTSVAAMQLVEKGTLSLDEPLGELLPELDALQVMDGFIDDGMTRFRPASGRITLKHLLTHTSGLSYPFSNIDLLMTLDPENPPKPGSMDSISLPLMFDPGERWEYGVSTDWVGLAVERASGQRLDAYIEEHITEPLGMGDTVFHLGDDQKGRSAAMHQRQEDGSLKVIPFSIGGPPDAELISGGGGLWSTARDYFHFLRCLLNGGNPVLKPETVATMGTNQIGNLRAGQMGTAMAELAQPFELFPDQHAQWGLGFLINPEPGPNGRAAGSLAWAGIANTHFWIDPANDLIGIFLTQLLPFADPSALKAFEAFERMAYGLD